MDSRNASNRLNENASGGGFRIPMNRTERHVGRCAQCKKQDKRGVFSRRIKTDLSGGKVWIHLAWNFCSELCYRKWCDEKLRLGGIRLPKKVFIFRWVRSRLFPRNIGSVGRKEMITTKIWCGLEVHGLVTWERLLRLSAVPNVTKIRSMNIPQRKSVAHVKSVRKVRSLSSDE